MSDLPSQDPAPLRGLDALTQAGNLAGSVLIFGLMLLIGADVAGRNFFGAPISGVPEIVKLSIVAIVFLQAPQALKAGRMTQSDAVINLLWRRMPRVAGLLETAFDTVAIIVVGAIFYATWPIFTRSWTRGDFVGAAGDFTAPKWPVKLMILIGCALLVAQFAARIVRRYK